MILLFVLGSSSLATHLKIGATVFWAFMVWIVQCTEGVVWLAGRDRWSVEASNGLVLIYGERNPARQKWKESRPKFAESDNSTWKHDRYP
jgi:hypothetical protein